MDKQLLIVDWLRQRLDGWITVRELKELSDLIDRLEGRPTVRERLDALK